MLERVNVYYGGWGERWLWGTLMSTTALSGRPQIVFEYSPEAKRRGLELSSHILPLEGPPLRMQSLAAFTRADYRSPGVLDYVNFLRATQLCTNDARQKALAFERVVFNVAFNNRDDHPKNFAYVMSASGEWTLAPAYDVTFCEGPRGYHQMDIMGEALEIDRMAMLQLAEEAEVSPEPAARIIDTICGVASQFATLANEQYATVISRDTLALIQGRIDQNVALLKGTDNRRSPT